MHFCNKIKNIKKGLFTIIYLLISQHTKFGEKGGY